MLRGSSSSSLSTKRRCITTQKQEEEKKEQQEEYYNQCSNDPIECYQFKRGELSYIEEQPQEGDKSRNYLQQHEQEHQQQKLQQPQQQFLSQQGHIRYYLGRHRHHVQNSKKNKKKQSMLIITVVIVLSFIVVLGMLFRTINNMIYEEQQRELRSFSPPTVFFSPNYHLTTSTSSNNDRSPRSVLHSSSSYEIIFAQSLKAITTTKTADKNKRNKKRKKRSSNDNNNHFDYVVSIPKDISNEDWYNNNNRYDYGDLELYLLDEDDVPRPIYQDPSRDKTNYRQYYEIIETKNHKTIIRDIPRDDDVAPYYAFDDDAIRGNYLDYNDHRYDDHHYEDHDQNYYNEEIEEEEHSHSSNAKCRRISDHRLAFPNCNSLHEVALLESNVKYLNQGEYRQVYVIDHTIQQNQLENIAVKELSYSNDAHYRNYEKIRIDAIIAERLTSYEQIATIYGYCGLSLLSEYFQHGDIKQLMFGKLQYKGYIPQPEEHKKLFDTTGRYPLIPKNENIFPNPIDKLEIALRMAESLAIVHGNINGVMVHDDVKLSQFLLVPKKKKDKKYKDEHNNNNNNSFDYTIKLNDFNRGEFMLWNDEEQDYCPYKNGQGPGVWRSPEEYLDKPLTEKIDVWSYCNNLYAILTGVNPFFDQMNSDKIRSYIVKGVIPYIDPRYKSRSNIEGIMVEILEQCYIYDPKERISMFTIVQLLQQTLLNENENETKKNDMKKNMIKKTKKHHKHHNHHQQYLKHNNYYIEKQ